MKTFQKLLVLNTVGVYVLALAFDLVVTYSVYSTNPEYFYRFERSRQFVHFIRIGTLPIWGMLAECVAFLPLLFYGLELKFKRNVFSILLIVFSIFTVIIGFMHLKGGLSWWRGLEWIKPI